MATEQIIGKVESGPREEPDGVFSFDGSINSKPLKSAFRNLFESSQKGSD